MENKEKIFIYGTLEDPGVQIKVWGRITKGASDVLRGYKKSEIKIDCETYPLIIPSELGRVEGLVIEVTNEELEKIDEYETSAYKRVVVSLSSGMSAWVYIKG